MLWIPFLVYVVVASFTPGPNNMISMASAGKAGYRKTLRFICGVAVGTSVIALVSCSFHMLLSELLPKLKPALSIAGGLYLTYLGLSVMLSRLDGGGPQGKEPASSFMSGVLLQFVNPKAILYSLTVVSAFIMPFYSSLLSLGLFAAFLGMVAFLSTSSWAVLGVMIQPLLRKHGRVFRFAMGLLLMYSALIVFLG